MHVRTDGRAGSAGVGVERGAVSEHSFDHLVNLLEEDDRVFQGKADLVQRLRTLDAWYQGGYEAAKLEAEQHARTCVHLYRRVLHVPF